MPLTGAAIRAAKAKQGRAIKLSAAYNYGLLYAKIRHLWTDFAAEKQRSGLALAAIRSRRR
jgi:hypothetical protein